MKKLSLAFLMVALCAIQACKSPESRSVDSNDSGTTNENLVNGGNAGNADSDAVNNESETAPGDITHKSNADDDSAMFIKEAGTGGLMEVAMGNIALKNASHANVKAFAQQMVTDHTKANNELSAIAKNAGIIIPTAFPPEKKAHMDKLKQLTGAEFDKQYMDMMVNDHQKTLELFKSGQKLVKDTLVAFAKKTTPVIEGHYAKAKEIKANIQ
jgi:putative membrane protein